MPRFPFAPSLLSAVGVAVAVALAADDKLPAVPGLSVNEIMVQAHLKPMNRATKNNLDNKLLDGNATAEEKQRLLDLYTELGKRKPPKGDAEGWAKRTDELVATTKELITGKEKAAERFLKARDCKGCHAAHRRP